MVFSGLLKNVQLLRGFRLVPEVAKYKCRRCGVLLSCEGKTLGLWHHMRCKHASVYIKLKSMQKVATVSKEGSGLKSGSGKCYSVILHRLHVNECQAFLVIFVFKSNHALNLMACTSNHCQLPNCQVWTMIYTFNLFQLN
jgi:hypothetical protein